MLPWPHVFQGSFLPAERTASVDRRVPIDFQAEVLHPGSTGSRPSTPIASALPLLALLLACVLLISICNRSRVKAAKPGSLGRRLAGDEGGEDSLSDSELELLCAAAQGWAPVEPQPGEPRRSPHVVAAFFELLGEPPLFEEGEAAAEQPTKARERDDGDSEEEQPGPSSKFTRTEEGRQPAGPPAPSSAAPPAPSASPGPGPSAADTQQSGQPQLGPASAGILPVSGDGPSTSTGTAAPPAAQAPAGAPQARRPLILPGVTPREWCANIVLVSRLEGRSSVLIQEVHTLLLKPVLDAEDVNKLMWFSERLANYLLHSFKAPTYFLNPSKFAIGAGIRFLAFSQLYAAVQAIGRGLPLWWQRVADVSLTGYTAPVWKHPGAAPTPRRQLAEDLASALALYRSGSAPPDEEVRRLMRLLLTDPDALSHFGATEWDFLRKDL